MKVEKASVRRYEVTPFGSKPFGKFGSFLEARQRMGMKTVKLERCFACRKAFADDEDVFVASVVPGVGNRFLCRECNSRALGEQEKAGGGAHGQAVSQQENL